MSLAALPFLDLKRRIGHIPGVKMEQDFRYRTHLMSVRLHYRPVQGIDQKEIKEPLILSSGTVIDSGTKLAVAIVLGIDFGRDPGDPAVKITYEGEGGEKQVMKRGKEALRNSMTFATPVRVLDQRHSRSTFTYCGSVSDFRLP